MQTRSFYLCNPLKHRWLPTSSVRRLLIGGLGVVTLMLVGCGSDSRSGEDEVQLTPIFDGVDSGGFHWQLQGTVNTGYAVEYYDIDLVDSSVALITDLKASDRIVICYFSAGSWEQWRDDADQFDAAVKGATLDGWADERWLDIRAENVRAVMRARLDLAVTKGCDGVEPDNVDGYQNTTGFALTAADQLDFNRFLAEAAQARGLLVALKNDLDQVAQLVDAFDFAINEECWLYDECALLLPFVAAGKPVFHIEYDSSLTASSAARAQFCADMNGYGFTSLVLPLELDDSFRYSCD